jgi:hypothetical protein
MADSNTTKKLSPSVPISRPSLATMAALIKARWLKSVSAYWSPRRFKSVVDPSMSLNIIVTVPVGSHTIFKH